LVQDQKDIWTSPAQLRLSDADWLVPLSGLTAGLLVTDPQFSGHLSRDLSTERHYRTLANGGTAALVGVGGGLALWGTVTHNPHRRETGFLAGESAVDSLVLVEALKYAAGRQRPFEGDGSGKFFHGGSSFPSSHAATAWSIAGVIAHEYPGPLPKLFAYGLAGAVSASRIRSRDHFPSDVLIGSAIGWLVSQHVYSKRHDPELGGSEWSSLRRFVHGEGDVPPNNQGSPYVPLDSWVYPAIDRLAALGYVKSAMAGMRPWTRLECVRLVNEAMDADDGASEEARRLIDTLEQELTPELAELGGGRNRHLRSESVYTRLAGISGKPLTDGFHFGRTLLNDFGRPFAEGVNNVTGFSGWASDGRFVAYLRGEYQYAPSIPALPLPARQFITNADEQVLPLPPGTAHLAVSHFQLLDAYVAMNLDNWQLSYGKQSLWWGPSVGGPMIFSDNAAPISMFRIDRVSPFKLPSILGWLGPTRVQFFMGQLTGHNFIFDQIAGLTGQWDRPLSRQPFIHAEKLSFKPTPDFEFSVSATTLFAGGPTPFNGYSLKKAFTSFIVPATDTVEDVTSAESVLDFTYRVPGMRKWLTFYGEAYSKDEYSPLGYPRKSGYQGGIYLPRIPGVPKLDFRAEGGSTNPPDFGSCVGCFYTNDRFVSGFTNQGNLLGSWLGRAGQGEQAWSTYWLSSRNKIQFHYRHQKAVSNFIPSGGTINDGSVRVDFLIHHGMSLGGSVQYEKWKYPLLSPKTESNVTASLQFTYWPHQSK
jgi:membrane-associated phospholipid phosphatase